MKTLRALSMIMLGAVIGSGVSGEVEAKTRYTAPKAFRHTWYIYDGHGKYNLLKFNKTTTVSRTYADGKYYGYTSKFKLQGPTKAGYWNLHGIHQTAGSGNFYKVVYKKIGGKRQAVLNTYYGFPTGIGHYYLFKTHRK